MDSGPKHIGSNTLGLMPKSPNNKSTTNNIILQFWRVSRNLCVAIFIRVRVKNKKQRNGIFLDDIGNFIEKRKTNEMKIR